MHIIYIREILDRIEIPGKFSWLWIHIESFFTIVYTDLTVYLLYCKTVKFIFFSLAP